MANVKDGATGTVLIAPSPQSSGNTLKLNSGESLRYPLPPFYAVAHPNSQIPVVSISEKILVTAVDTATDIITFTRAISPYTAKNIDVGWRISNAIFQDDFNNASIINNEVPAGLVNGTNPTFTLASPVHTTGSLVVHRNGIRLKGGGNDFTETATGFTMTTPPATGALLLVDYIVAGAINNVGTNSLITDETPAGAVNASNKLYTAARPYIPGSLEVHINGWKQKRTVHFVETNPAAGTFTMDDAPLTGDDIMINYAFNLNPSGNTDTVDGFNASATPTANTLYPLGSDSKFNVKVLPGTILATATRNTALAYTGGDQQILSIVVTVTQDMIDSGRKLKLTFFAPQLYSNDSSSRARVTIYEGATVLTRTYQPMQGGSVLSMTVNIATPGMAMPSLGNHTYTVNFSRDVGTGTSTLYAETGADMWLEAEVK